MIISVLTYMFFLYLYDSTMWINLVYSNLFDI
jgi:hypothetical protein